MYMCGWILVAIGCGAGSCLHTCNLISLLSYRCVQDGDSLGTLSRLYTDVHEQMKEFTCNIQHSYISSTYAVLS